MDDPRIDNWNDGLAKLAVGDETELWASYKRLRFKITLERVE